MPLDRAMYLESPCGSNTTTCVDRTHCLFSAVENFATCKRHLRAVLDVVPVKPESCWLLSPGGDCSLGTLQLESNRNSSF